MLISLHAFLLLTLEFEAEIVIDATVSVLVCAQAIFFFTPLPLLARHVYCTVPAQIFLSFFFLLQPPPLNAA